MPVGQLLRLQRQLNPAGGGELDGITHQINKNLTQAAGITHQRCLLNPRNIQNQFDVLFKRFDGQGRHHMGHHLNQIVINVLYFQFARFNLRQIQHIIDQ